MEFEEILQTLRQMEVALHQVETRRDESRLLALLHPDFVEFGRTGHKYSLADILEEFSGNKELPEVASWDFSLSLLGKNLALLTYTSAHIGSSGGYYRHTLRSSLWMLTEEGWKLRFHQGTPVEDAR